MPENLEVLSPEVAGRALHERRGHQIELEMQNEELRRSHLALEEARDRYLQLFDFSPVCYLTLTEDGLIKEANLTCSSLLGVDRNKLINRRFAHYVAPEDGDRWHRHFLHAKRQGGKQNYELTLHRADGTPFQAHLDCLPLETDDASPMLHITIIDITERKRIEEVLRIAAVAFEANEGIIVTDAHKVILRVNQAFSRIFGYSAEEVVGQTPSFLSSGLHDDKFYQAMWASMARDACWQGEVWDKRKNGAVFPLWLTISAVTNADGDLANYVGSVTDITVQKQAEQVLKNARRRLENQVATSEDELTRIKHETAEINTALDVLLKHRETDRSDAQEALSREVEGTVLPFLKKLKSANTDRGQTQLIDIVEANLQHLVKIYGRPGNLPAIYQRLTPVEIQVASLVRQGLPTKIIAGTLNLSAETVNVHRKHIRKKLGLESKSNNLQGYLMSLADH